MVVAVFGEQVCAYEYATGEGRRPFFTPYMSPQIKPLEGKNFHASVQLIGEKGNELVADETFEFILVSEPSFQIQDRRNYIRAELRKLFDEGQGVSRDDYGYMVDDRNERNSEWWDKVERFLVLHLDETYIERFQKGGVSALGGFLGDFPD